MLVVYGSRTPTPPYPPGSPGLTTGSPRCSRISGSYYRVLRAAARLPEHIPGTGVGVGRGDTASLDFPLYSYSLVGMHVIQYPPPHPPYPYRSRVGSGHSSSGVRIRYTRVTSRARGSNPNPTVVGGNMGVYRGYSGVCTLVPGVYILVSLPLHPLPLPLDPVVLQSVF